jgi:carboxymethylenebutenolidase
MNHISAVVLVCVLTALGLDARAQEPQRLMPPDGATAVSGVLGMPATPGPHPGVVILHGSFGWRPVYAQVARQLADSGFAALAIDYFSETGRDTTRQQRLQMGPRWRATIRRAIEYLQAQPSVARDRIGLVGYSRGAFLAVSVASSIPSVKAVVDFFGGIDTSEVPFEEQVRHFPSLLILHGEADTVVPVTKAYELRDAVMRRGGPVETHIYPGANHAFNGTFTPSYSEAAALDSFNRMVVFLRKQLTTK